MNPPVACALGAADLARRAAEIRSGILASAVRVERAGSGFCWTFDSVEDLFARLGPVIDAERRCCPFLHFTIAAQPEAGQVTLEIAGPEGTAAFLEDWIPRR